MRVALVYNYESRAVINRFGRQNKETYDRSTITAIEGALKERGHRVSSFEADKHIIERLEQFMPTVIAGEQPGLVFNLSYGIQGRARYTHLPAILEMLGLPYLGSGPNTQALALDKALTKVVLEKAGLPTPAYRVIESIEECQEIDLAYPLIVKPKDEAVSFGLSIAEDEKALIRGVEDILEEYGTGALVEQYIEGREVNVSVVGNDPPEVLPAVELLFPVGPAIFTYEDKKHLSGREVIKSCPAQIDAALEERLGFLAKRAFTVLGCSDLIRVDFRIDSGGKPYILEVNTMPSLVPDSSFLRAAEMAGYSQGAIIEHLLQVAYHRYHGFRLPTAHAGAATLEERLRERLIHDRMELEEELAKWVLTPTFSGDLIAMRGLRTMLATRLEEIGLHADERIENREVMLYSTDGRSNPKILMVCPLDLPGRRWGSAQVFRREDEWLYGEGIASSRAGLTVALGALQALAHEKVLGDLSLGLFLYTDEDRGMAASHRMLRRLSRTAEAVLVLTPGGVAKSPVVKRAGLAVFRVVLTCDLQTVSSHLEQTDLLAVFQERLEEVRREIDGDGETHLHLVDLETDRYSMLLPYRVEATLHLAYRDEMMKSRTTAYLSTVFTRFSPHWRGAVEKTMDRPPYTADERLVALYEEVSSRLGFTCHRAESRLPSAAGDVFGETPVLCGLGPASRGLFTTNEAVHRPELIERSLVLTGVLLEGSKRSSQQRKEDTF
jgi:D-alanine-D-alanine ligase